MGLPLLSSKISSGPAAPVTRATFTASALCSRLPLARRRGPSKLVKWGAWADGVAAEAVCMPQLLPGLF
jgi:hypothetical protein